MRLNLDAMGVRAVTSRELRPSDEGLDNRKRETILRAIEMLRSEDPADQALAVQLLNQAGISKEQAYAYANKLAAATTQVAGPAPVPARVLEALENASERALTLCDRAPGLCNSRGDALRPSVAAGLGAAAAALIMKYWR